MDKVVVGIISRITNSDKTEYLLMRSIVDFGQYTGFFYPPSGHLEKGESEQEGLIREIKEELGITVSPTEKIVETASDVENNCLCLWRCETENYQLNLQTDEVAEVRWFTSEEIIKTENIWPATKKFFIEYIL